MWGKWWSFPGIHRGQRQGREECWYLEKQLLWIVLLVWRGKEKKKKKPKWSQMGRLNPDHNSTLSHLTAWLQGDGGDDYIWKTDEPQPIRETSKLQECQTALIPQWPLIIGCSTWIPRGSVDSGTRLLLFAVTPLDNIATYHRCVFTVRESFTDGRFLLGSGIDAPGNRPDQTNKF